jgi:electron transfer flavoprotein alpha subunit
MPIVVDINKCSGCESCLSSCPYDAIEIKDGKAYINEYCQICSACLETCPEGAISEIKDVAVTAEASNLADYKGVWVFAEQRGGEVAGVGFELLGAGRRLADSLGVELCAVLLGAPKGEAEKLIHHGADKVYLAEDEGLKDFNDEPYAAMLRTLAEEHKPEIILAGATTIGRSFLPRVAAAMRAGLTADCTGLEIDEESRNLMQTRPAFGGNIMATIVCPSRRPQIATVRPRVMKALEADTSRVGEIVGIDIPVPVSRTKVVETITEAATDLCNIQDADVLVAGGRGLGGEHGFGMLRELAQLLGGTVAASRAAVDEGWIPYRHQVGQTGRTVCPKVYIACGISGAVQHLVGMQSSDIIFAINKNPDAPIFSVATYGIVGDVHEVVPALIKKIKQEKGIA